MTAAVIIAKLEEAGVRLTVDAGRLRMRATSPPPPDLLAEARAARAEILVLMDCMERGKMAAMVCDRDGWDVCGHEAAP